MSPQGTVILLVEDENAIRMMLEDALDEAGFIVRTASTGADAVKAISECADLKVLITDIRLGPAPDGWEVAHNARHVFSEIAVVYLSGDSGVDWMANGVPKSVLIQKPFVPVQVITAVATLLNESDSSV